MNRVWGAGSIVLFSSGSQAVLLTAFSHLPHLDLSWMLRLGNTETRELPSCKTILEEKASSKLRAASKRPQTRSAV